jgi:Uma2 family endonuclease
MTGIDMSALHKKPYLSEQAYLEFEELSDLKHEYVDGEVYAMQSSTESHNLIMGNIAFKLRLAARGSHYGVFFSAMKLRLDNGRFYYYPDVMLVCDANDNQQFYKEQPCFIAEVLSLSTSKVDQREKWLNYQKLPSLRYYLLVDSTCMKVHYFVRDSAGDWYSAELEDEESIFVQCDEYQTRLTLRDIYEDVIF